MIQPLMATAFVQAAPLKLGVLVTGSRNWRWPLVTGGVIRWPGGPVTLLHGGADGADKQMARHAADQGWNVLPPFLPDYQKFPPRVAPLIRNQAMISKLTAMLTDGEIDLAVCVALWRNHSGGTGHTRTLAIDLGIPVVTRYDCGCHTLTGEQVPS